MKNKIAVLIVSTFMLSACGGGGGGNSDSGTVIPPANNSTGSISGSVAGTTIIAMNASGDIVATDETAGRERDIDSDGDGLLDAFSFTLDGIPLNEDITVYLVTGGNIYPMYFDTNNDGAADSNIFALSASGQLALGFIGVDDEDGRAIPSSNPINDTQVTAKGVLASIPIGINEPPTAGLSVSQLNAMGQNAAASGWILGAKTYFQAAVGLSAGAAGNDADIARFMLALSRVAALQSDTLSDGNAEDKGRLGDLLDLFGFANDNSRSNWDLILDEDRVPEQNPLSHATIPDSSPTGNDIRDFAYDVVRPALQAAAEELDAVSGTFDTVITAEGEEVNVDQTDALFLSGLFRTAIASIDIQRAYNLNVDIDAIFNYNLINNDSQTAEDIRNANGPLLGTPDSSKLAEAKQALSAALVSFKSASDSIIAETDNQADDLITLGDTSNDHPLSDWVNRIEQAQASIAGNSTNIAHVLVDLQKFFDGGIVLDDSTLPAFDGNNAMGLFPDPTFGGVIQDTDTVEPGIQDLNEDTHPTDGIPDTLD